jgi:hypothetical protein
VKPCFLLAVLLLVLAGCSKPMTVAPGECLNQLSSQEQAAGWRLLFDGKSLDQWRNYGSEGIDGWGVQQGCLAWQSSGGDLISREQFGDFELKLEWRISAAGNSGIFIRGDESGKTIHYTGFEMQVLDNSGHRDAEDPSHRAGAYYDMIAPDHDTTEPVGFWNQVHIIAEGPSIQFWLNGKLTAGFEQMSPQWEALYQQSKFTDRKHYGRRLQGHIGFQDHWNRVLFRNIRVLDKR